MMTNKCPMRNAKCYALILWACVMSQALAQETQGGKSIARETDSPAGKGKSMAILIGVQEYASVPPLKYCEADVELLADTLTRYCKFDTVIKMTDSAKERRYLPTLGNLSRELRLWFRVANNDGYQRLLVYFSGHGFRDAQNRLYFAPPDCDRQNLELTALPHSLVKQLLDGCTRVPVKLLVLDCCHAGEGRGDGVGASGDAFATEFRNAKGLLTIASCRDEEISLEWPEQRQGLFTYWFAKGLRGEADRDRDGLVDNHELHRFVFGNVLTTAARMGREQNVVLRPSDDWRGIAVLSQYGSPGSSSPPSQSAKPPFVATPILNVEASAVTSIACDPHSSLVLVGHRDASASLWDLESAALRHSFRGHGSTVKSVAFGPVKGQVITGSYDGSIVLWELVTCNRLQRLETGMQGVFSVATHRNGLIVASGAPLTSGDGYASVWRSGSLVQVSECHGHTGAVWSVAMFPDGQQFASGGEDGVIKVWDTATGRQLRSFSEHRADAYAITLSRDGSQLASASGDRTAVLRDALRGDVLQRFRGHSAAIRAVAISPNQQLVATGSDDRTAAVWDVASGKQLYSLAANAAGVQAVAFASDARLLTGDANGFVRVWNVETGKLLATLVCATQGEWLIVTPQGYYVSDGNVAEYMSWEADGAKTLNTDRESLSKQLNRRDIVTTILGQSDSIVDHESKER